MDELKSLILEESSLKSQINILEKRLEQVIKRREEIEK